MAAGDIRIHTQMEGGTGFAALAAGQTFENGEIVVVGAAGTLAEAGDDPAVVAGISIGSSQGLVANASPINLSTIATGTLIPFYKPVSGQLFKTDNFATDGAGTAATPAVTTIGDTAGFTLAGAPAAWSLDTGAANAHVEVVDVLDSRGHSVGDTTIRTAGTGVTVVFGFI